MNTVSAEKKTRNPHDGHRKRTLGKVRDGNVSSFTEVELLETALFYVIRRGNTNVIAHDLLDTFGSLKGVLNAEMPDICSVRGAGEKTAVYLTVLGELYNRINASVTKKEKRFTSIEQIGQFFIKKFAGVNKERVMLLALDNRNALVDCKVIHEGTVSSSDVSTRDVIKTALILNAARIVIAHNHPSGDASPSDDDIVLTRSLRRALGEVDIDLVEHILVADDGYMPLVSYMTRATELDYGS